MLLALLLASALQTTLDAAVTPELAREYVTPDTVIDEDLDPWRPLFRELFWPRVKDCSTIREAASILVTNVYPTLGIRYDIRRDKANQSPFHSMRIGMASCTGMTIAMIDAFRACGIPARLVGCCWTPIPGNHSWMEFWDGEGWHFFGDPDASGVPPIDSAWFTEYAALADESSPRTRIYASRATPSPDGTRFWSTWNGANRPSAVPADDVTASYRRFRSTSEDARMSFVALGPDGRRTAVRFRVIVAGSGRIIHDGFTYDESHDMNDHAFARQPPKTTVYVQVLAPDGSWRTRGSFVFGATPLVTL